MVEKSLSDLRKLKGKGKGKEEVEDVSKVQQKVEEESRHTTVLKLLFFSPLWAYLSACVQGKELHDGFPLWSGMFVKIIFIVFAAVTNLLWFDSISLFLFLLALAAFPVVTILITAIIVAPAFQGPGIHSRKHPLGGGDAMDVLFRTFEEQLTRHVEYPGLVGYYGWNYEAAVALGALKSNNSQSQGIQLVLENAMRFPQAGFWIKNGFPVFWLYSVGDRVGLFGGLYKEIDEIVYKYALEGTRNWPKVNGCIVRALSWRKIFFGLDKDQKWLWADDVYMAGATLLQDHPDEVETYLLGIRKYLNDPETGLWWHGAMLDLSTEQVKEVNGQKWGRAHAWVLLTLARYAETTGNLLWLEEELDNTAKYQRASGAFGNLVDDHSSPDESSLTSIFVFAVGVLKELTGKTSYVSGAVAAWEWLNNREVNGFGMSDTCGAAPLGRTPHDYNKAVHGLQHGPAIAFTVWARIGAQKLSLI